MAMNTTESISTNFTCGPWNISEDEASFADMFGWIIQGIFSSIIGCVGVILNVLVATVYLKNNLEPIIFHKLLVLLSVFDGLFLLCSVYESIRLYTGRSDYCGTEDHLLIVLYPLRKMAMCGAIYTTLAATVERYSAINKPFQDDRNWVGIRGSVKFSIYAVPTILFSVLICVPLCFALKIYELHPSNATKSPKDEIVGQFTNLYGQFSNNYSIFEERKWCVGPTELRLNPEYLLWYNIVTMGLLTGVIPMFIIAILNLRIYKIVSRIKKVDGERKTFHDKLKTARVALARRFTIHQDDNRVLKRMKDRSRESELETSISEVENLKRTVLLRSLPTEDVKDKTVQTNKNLRFKKRVRQFSERQFTIEKARGVAALFGVVIIFLLCHTIRMILNIEELITHKELRYILEQAQKKNIYCSGVQFWTVIANDISHLLMQISSTSNFFIYYFSSKSFRKAINNMTITQ